MTRFIVEPIDIDFAGWTVVEEGQHNEWGIIDTQPEIHLLVGRGKTKEIVQGHADAFNLLGYPQPTNSQA
jgi:hypothetical protein